MKEEKKTITEEEIISQNSVINTKIDEINKKANIKFNQTIDSLEKIKDNITKKKDKGKKIKKVDSSNIKTDTNMIDIIDDLRIN